MSARGDLDSSPEQAVKARRGTTNGNARGSVYDRAARRRWLLVTFRADHDLMVIDLPYGPIYVEVELGEGQIACRCYRCGRLLIDDTVTVDRIRPGCDGGTYVRSNLRPACGPCNSETGGALSRRKKQSTRSGDMSRSPRGEERT